MQCVLNMNMPLHGIKHKGVSGASFLSIVLGLAVLSSGALEIHTT